uniref:Tropomyosin n=1 Tax=Ditylenchus dipsaci TaxID=166011 RepID=A0A915EL48_9BILA
MGANIIARFFLLCEDLCGCRVEAAHSKSIRCRILPDIKQEESMSKAQKIRALEAKVNVLETDARDMRRDAENMRRDAENMRRDRENMRRDAENMRRDARDMRRRIAFLETQ